MVPEGWKVTSLGAALDRVSRAVQVLADQRYTQIGIRSHGRGIFIKEPVYGCELGDKRMFHLEADCLVLNIVFAWEQAVGKTDNSHIGLVASHRFPMYRPKKGACDIEFLRYYFLTPRGKYLLGLASPGGAGRNKTLGQKEFERLTIALPPLHEQKKIAEILSTWDKAIKTTEKLLANAEAQKRALIRQLLDKTFWPLIKISELGTVRSAGVDKKEVEGQRPIRLLNYLDIMRRDHIFSNELDHWVTAPERQIENCDIRKGDVFFTPSSETRDDIGHSAVAMEDISDAAYSYHIVRFRPTVEMDVDFSAYAFKSRNFYQQCYTYCEGSGQRYVISQDYLRSFTIGFPPMSQQREIGKILSTADALIKKHKKELAGLRTEKRALMQQLLTGKRRVTV